MGISLYFAGEPWQRIAETSAPSGYEVDSTPHTVNVMPLSNGETTSYTMVNNAKAGLRIYKNEEGTTIGIPGVTFEIWKDGALYDTLAFSAPCPFSKDS